MIAPPVPHLAQRQNFFAHQPHVTLCCGKTFRCKDNGIFCCCFVDRHTIAHIVMEGSCFQRPQNPQLPEAWGHCQVCHCHRWNPRIIVRDFMFLAPTASRRKPTAATWEILQKNLRLEHIRWSDNSPVRISQCCVLLPSLEPAKCDHMSAADACAVVQLCTLRTRAQWKLEKMVQF